MNYRIEFSEQAQRVIKKLKKSNPRSFKKLYNLLPELELHPRTGTGHPEPLKGGGDITYSRRLSRNDRVIYDIYDQVVTVLIISVEGRYDDK